MNGRKRLTIDGCVGRLRVSIRSFVAGAVAVAAGVFNLGFAAQWVDRISRVWLQQSDFPCEAHARKKCCRQFPAIVRLKLNFGQDVVK